MKVMIEVIVDDEFVAGRVRELNAEIARGEWGKDEVPTTPESYVRSTVTELVCEDALPLALFSWPVEARIVSVE